jgi:hypothetical protein
MVRRVFQRARVTAISTDIAHAERAQTNGKRERSQATRRASFHTLGLLVAVVLVGIVAGGCD